MERRIGSREFFHFIQETSHDMRSVEMRQVFQGYYTYKKYTLI